MKKYNNLLTRLITGFKELDFIGPQFSLQNSDSQRFQSIQGSLWSILTIIIMLVAGFLFGKEIYERKNPRVSTNTENIDNSDIYFSQFPLMFTLITSSGRVLTDSDFRKYLEPIITRIQYDENGLLKVDSKIVDYESCSVNKFTKYSDKVNDEMLKYQDNRYLCLSFDKSDFFSNTIFAKNSTNYNIGFRKCRQNCADDLEQILSMLLLDIAYLTSFVDLNNYLDPIKIYLEHLTTQIDLSLFRRSYMRFVYNMLTSDYGWFIESLETNEIPYLQSLVPDDMGYMNEGNWEQCLFMLSVESPKSRNVFNRNYMKLQELLANLGGLSNAVIVFIRLISDSHLKFIMYFFVKECAIQSLEKSSLENSISQNMKEMPHKDIDIGYSSIKQTKLDEKKSTKVDSRSVKLEDPRNTLKKSLHKENDGKSNKNKEESEHPNVQTVIRFNNKGMEDYSSGRNAIKEDNKNDLSNSESFHIKEQLKIMKTKMSFFSPSVMQTIKSVKGNESFTNFVIAKVCCQREKEKYYMKQLKSIRKLISIHTYTSLIISQCNTDEYQLYDSLRANA